MEKTKDRKLDRKIAELTHKFNLFDMEEILDVAIEQIPSILQAHRVSIYLIDEEEKCFVARRRTSHKLQEHFVEKIDLGSKHSILPHVLEKNEPVLIQDVQEYIQKHRLDIDISKRQRYTSGSCIVVPIKVRLPNDREKVLGMVNFAEKADFTSFTKYDLDLAGHLVELLGTAIHNCSVVEKKLGGRQKELLTQLNDIKEAFAQKDIGLDEAKKRQTQMLPQRPVIAGYDLEVEYSPMETIGGDFYDFIQISECEIGIVLGDVSGHGIEAALVMSMAKQILSIYSKLHRSLTETLAHANDEIFANLKGESFIAVFLGLLNTTTHVLRYVRAGQTYPMLYNPEREPPLSELKSKGVVLGTIRGHGDRFRSMIEERYIQFMPGDVLLLYTDGAIEANNPEGADYSVEKLMEGLKNFASKNAGEIVHGLKQDIWEFTMAPQEDDITLLCLKAGNIAPAVSFNTQKLEKSLLQEAESYIVAPELSYDEDVQYEIMHLEEKISELEFQLENLEKTKGELEDRCEELSTSLEMVTSDPDSYMSSLRNQLQVALELPRDLIADNGKLHQEIQQQKKELSSLESELNHVVSDIEILKEEKKKLEREVKAKEKLRRDCWEQMEEEIQNSSGQFDKKIQEYLLQRDFEGSVQMLVKYFNIAIEQMDMSALSTFQRQHFYLTNFFLRYLREFIGEKP